MNEFSMYFNPCQPVIDAVQTQRGHALDLADDLAHEIVGWDHDLAGSVLSVLIVGAALKDPAECTLAMMHERLVDRDQLLAFCKDLASRGLRQAGRAAGALDRGVGLLAQNIIEQQEVWPETLLMARLRAANSLRPFAAGSVLAAVSAHSSFRMRSMEDWRAFRSELAKASSRGFGPFIWAARLDLGKHGIVTTPNDLQSEWNVA